LGEVLFENLRVDGATGVHRNAALREIEPWRQQDDARRQCDLLVT
jgi:hypothetical protein